MSQRTKTIIISIVVCIVLAGIGVGLYCAWPAIAGTITGNAYYTYEDVQNAYNDGYTNGIRNEEELTAQIDYYKAEVDKYIVDLKEAQTEIENLEKDLQDAINSGNVDKETIAGLQEDLAEAQAELTAKQEQIEELQDDIKYYEELLEAYGDSDKLRVTFTMVDNGKERNYDVLVVEPNSYLTAVVTPDRADFEGWSLSKGGELIDDLTTIQVTENMTIYGMCTNTVTFMLNGKEYNTQEVSYNKYASDVDVNLTGYTFNGWSLTEDGEPITLSTTPIIKDTTFYAQCNQKNISFEPYSWNGLTEFNGNCVWTDGQNVYYSNNQEQYVLNQETSTWEEKIWYGSMTYPMGYEIWTDGQSFYWTESYSLNNKTYYNHYVLNKNTSTWEPTVFYGLDNASSFAGNSVWTDGQKTYYSYYEEQYVLNKETSTWEEKVWNGFTDFQGSYVWTDGQNIYCSASEDNQYVLNIKTSTWEEKVWVFEKDSFYVKGDWTDGQDIFSFRNAINGIECYVLEKQTYTWKFLLTLNLENIDYAFSPVCIWSDGTNCFYSQLSDQFILKF